jgi:formylglycine-generating enzyme required for sulfatase activity
MALIPAGPSIASFYLDIFEVTNEQFLLFVKENPQWGPPPNSRDRRAVTQVSWQAANAYAKWTGKRLPTEAEWEHAARGGLANALYPWGNAAPDPTRANYIASDHYGPVEGGRYPANGYGLHDMSGNAWEWCADRTPNGQRVIKGGGYADPPEELRTSSRATYPETTRAPQIGFRCAKSLG